MPVIKLNGVDIDFPFEPYDVQKIYMSKVIECLQNKKHGVLESPTGTGKTLCLLCSSLSWLMTKKAQVQAQNLIGSIPSVNFGGEFFDRLKNNLEKAAGVSGKDNSSYIWSTPKIIYSSRTHSQLTQVMQELKRTSFKHLKVAVIGSRDQLCIHPEISKEENTTDKIHMCQAKVKSRSCIYYNNVETRKEEAIFKDEICDIEDLVKAGKKMKCCPYFLAKELKQNADITFMPYNYLLDSKIRKSQGIDLQNQVILLDEAHNIEKTCEDAASLQISSTDIALCIEEVTSVMKSFADDVETNFDLMADTVEKDFTPDDLCTLKEIFLDLEKAIDEIVIKNPIGDTYSGNYVFELLEKIKLTQGRSVALVDKIDKIVVWLTTTSTSPFSRQGRYLQKFSDFLKIVFNNGSSYLKHVEQVKKCYKVYIKREEIKSSNRNDGWDTKKISKKNDGKEGKIICYWCFSPGFGMEQLIDLGVHSIILTSGTLSPLQPFISELRIPIDIQLENPHIVKSNQISVGILSKGPNGHTLNSSYNTRNDPKYIESLGGTILNFSCLIPDGLLVFFPSYSVMKKCQTDWQNSGLWSKITDKKTIYVETQSKNEFTNIMNEYYEKIKNPSTKGAIFFAVCRGKVSEGLDFADANGRAVLITGLPFPPMNDPRVLLKQQYLNEVKKSNNGLSGQQWYQLEASRAVNQAVGRIIRHINDYGAIIFCDCRFDSPAFKEQLSAWLRPHIKKYQDFGSVTRELRDFFKNPDRFGSNTPSNSYSNDSHSVAAQSQPSLPSTSSGQSVIDKSDNFNVNLYKDKKKSNVFVDFVSKKWDRSTDNSVSSDESAPKKRKLNVKPIINYSSTGSATPTSSNANNSIQLDIQSLEETERKAIGQTYLKNVKKSLTKENFIVFGKSIADYKKNNDLKKLLNNLEKLFITDNQNHQNLFYGFKTFIKKQHFQQFDQHLKQYYQMNNL